VQIDDAGQAPSRRFDVIDTTQARLVGDLDGRRASLEFRP
jgi:hypothetical protein